MIKDNMPNNNFYPFLPAIQSIKQNNIKIPFNQGGNPEENEYSNEIDKNFINKNIIDLSFLDHDNKDPEEKESKINGINPNNINGSNNNYNIDNNGKYYQTQNIEKNKELYQMMISKSLCQNYNYYPQNSFIINNINNYNLMNNLQQLNQTNLNVNEGTKNKIAIDKKYLINIIDIKTGKEERTTIRMMNIPSYFRPEDLAKKLDDKLGIFPEKENRIYNFIYIPIKNKKNGKIVNAGFAFINFLHPKHILKFYSLFHGKHLKSKASGKICIITFASKQGINLKNINMDNSNNDKYMLFSDTKNHFQLLDG